ncbi:hypothetical protein Tco_0736209 [Tanacetum coccineum]
MISPNKPTSKTSRVAKMSVKPIWRKKPNLCNTSNVLNATSLMPKPLTPHHEPSQENNHPNQALPNPYIKDTTISPQVVSHPPFPISPINLHVTHTQALPQSDNQTPYIKDTPTSPQVVLHPPLTISPINSHIAHTQAPPQSDNQTQHTPPLSLSRESLIDDINQLQDLSNLLAMHLSQQQNNIPSSAYSLNLPHTLNINQVETYVGSGLVSNHIPQQPCKSTKQNMDRLFQPMFDEYFNPPTIDVSPVLVVAAPRVGLRQEERIDFEESFTLVATIEAIRIFVQQEYDDLSNGCQNGFLKWRAQGRGEPVDATLYRGMIGSLMYLTSTYSDADHAGCQDTRRNTPGSPQFLGDKLASWSSKKQKMENGIVELYFVRTEYQLADIFTKPLPRERFNFLIEKLGKRSMSLEMLKRLTEEEDE